MTRLICSILAAGSTAISLAAPASAHEAFEPHQTAPVVRSDYDGYRERRVDYDRYRGEEWRELQFARHRFYSRPHSRWERMRFERWYAHRCDELRFHRY